MLSDITSTKQCFGDGWFFKIYSVFFFMLVMCMYVVIMSVTFVVMSKIDTCKISHLIHVDLK